jgi:hypothetical protein
MLRLRAASDTGAPPATPARRDRCAGSLGDRRHARRDPLVVIPRPSSAEESASRWTASVTRSPFVASPGVTQIHRRRVLRTAPTFGGADCPPPSIAARYLEPMAAPTLEPTLRRLTRAEYDRMVELGFFRGERLELIHGSLLRMPRVGPPRASVVSRLNRLLLPRLVDRADVRIQQPRSSRTTTRSRSRTSRSFRSPTTPGHTPIAHFSSSRSPTRRSISTARRRGLSTRRRTWTSTGSSISARRRSRCTPSPRMGDLPVCVTCAGAIA